MDKLIYKNRSGITQNLIGYGTVEPGKTIEVDSPIYNQNFILVNGGRMVNVEKPITQPDVKSLKK